MLGTWLNIQTPLIELDESSTIPEYTVQFINPNTNAASWQPIPESLADIANSVGVSANDIGTWNNFKR